MQYNMIWYTLIIWIPGPHWIFESFPGVPEDDTKSPTSPASGGHATPTSRASVSRASLFFSHPDAFVLKKFWEVGAGKPISILMFYQIVFGLSLGCWFLSWWFFHSFFSIRSLVFKWRTLRRLWRWRCWRDGHPLSLPGGALCTGRCHQSVYVTGRLAQFFGSKLLKMILGHRTWKYDHNSKQMTLYIFGFRIEQIATKQHDSTKF